MTRFPIAVAVALAAASAAAAQTAPEGLSEPGRVLYDHIVEQIDILTPQGGELRHGPIAVEELAAGYVVAIPDLAIVMPDGITVNYGTLRAELTPDSPGVYGVVMDFPDLITVNDGAGAEIAHATIGETSFTGTWAPETGGYLDQTLRAANIVLSMPDAGLEARADRVAYETALTADGATKVSGPSAFTIAGLSVRDGQGNEIVNLGTLSGTSAVRALDRAAMVRMKDGMAALGQQAEPSQPLDLSFMPLTPGEILGDGSTDVTLENMAVADPTGGGGVFIDRLAFAAGFADLDAPLARLDLSYRHDGLSLTGAAVSPLVPDAINIDLAVERLPAARLYAMAIAAAAAAAAAPDAAGAAAMAQLPALFAEAATEISIAALDISMAGAQVQGSGTVAGDPAATGGVVGALTLFASGLEGAIAALTANQEDQDAMQAGFFLSMFQSLGAPETAADGAPVLAYRIEFDPAGDHRLNGQSIAQMFGAMGGEGATP